MSERVAPHRPRVIGVDVARALALLGMVVAHLIDKTSAGTEQVSPWFQLVAGRPAALFAVLAGVSLVLSLGATGAVRPGDRRAVAVRALVIGVLGLLLGPIGEIADIAVILTYYGALFLCALPVLGWSARALALLAAAWALTAPVLSALLRTWLAEPTLQIPHPSSLLDPVGLASELLVTGYYPCLTWATYLFAGMAIGRLDLRRPVAAAQVAIGGLVLAALTLVVSAMVLRSPAVIQRLLVGDVIGSPEVAAELRSEIALGFFGTAPTGSWWWLAVWAPHSGSIVDLLHTTGCAMAVLGGCVFFTGRLPAPQQHVVAVAFGAGRMTLTLYVLHVVLTATAETTAFTSSIAFQVAILTGLGALFALLSVPGPLEATATRAQGLAPRLHQVE